MYGNRALVSTDAQEVIADAHSVLADRCVMYGNRALIRADAYEVIADALIVVADAS